MVLIKTPEMKIRVYQPLVGDWRQWRIFDIVNGFFNRCRGDTVSVFGLRPDQRIGSLQIIIWLRFLTSTSEPRQRLPSGDPISIGEPSAVDGDVDSQA